MLIDFRQLWPKYGITPKGVLHIGANVGEEAPVYLELGVKKQIWIEANPEIYEKLKVNILGNPEAFAICCAAGNEEKKITLHISNNAGQSSSVLNLGTHKKQHPDVHYIKDIEVSMVRMDSFWPKFGHHDMTVLDFLNIDVQGFELPVLKGIGGYISQFKWIYLEVNSDHVYEGCALLSEIEEYLKPFGFKRAELKWASANLTWGDCLFIK